MKKIVLVLLSVLAFNASAKAGNILTLVLSDSGLDRLIRLGKLDNGINIKGKVRDSLLFMNSGVGLTSAGLQRMVANFPDGEEMLIAYKKRFFELLHKNVGDFSEEDAAEFVMGLIYMGNRSRERARSALAHACGECLDFRGVGFNAYLVEAIGREMAEPSKPSRLESVVKSGSVDELEGLIAGGGDLDVLDKNGDTALILAFRLNRTDMANALIKAGADVDVRSLGDGETALGLAASRGNAEGVSALIKAGADVDRQGYLLKHTALIRAVENGKKDVAAALIESGADLTLKNYLGESAFDIAVRKRIEGFERLLRWMEDDAL